MDLDTIVPLFNHFGSQRTWPLSRMAVWRLSRQRRTGNAPSSASNRACRIEVSIGRLFAAAELSPDVGFWSAIPALACSNQPTATWAPMATTGPEAGRVKLI